MSIELWVAFIIASSVLLVIPGPTILTVISYSVVNGKRANIPLVAAVALGDSTALFLSLVGLGVLLAASSWMFTAVKLAGGLYLVYLGVKLFLRGKSSSTKAVSHEAFDSSRKLFFNTWLVTALNPKGIIFFIAFFPQFIDPALNVTFQLSVLSVTFVLLAILNTSLYVFFAVNARQLLTSPKALRRFNLGGGGLLTIAGIWALSSERPT